MFLNKSKGNLALVFDQESVMELRRCAVHQRSFYHHCVLEYDVTEDGLGKYADRVGETIELMGTWLIRDHKCQILLLDKVKGIEGDSPYVTISCAPDVAPVHGLQLVNGDRTGIRNSVDLHLRAKFAFIPFAAMTHS